MSARNSQANKAAARERLRQERERQAKKDKTRRQLVVIGSTIVVLAIAGGAGYAIMQANKPGHWESVKDEKNITAPKNTEGENGTTVVIGKPAAKKTLELYEDSRCPVCASFEQAVGETVNKDVDAGKYKLKYIGATFIDNADQGEGSKNALSALGAALDVSPEAFSAYKAALYSAKFHPEETQDKFAKDSLPARGRGHGPGAEEQRRLQEERRGRDVRRLGDEDVGDVRQERGRRHPDAEDGRQEGHRGGQRQPADDGGAVHRGDRQGAQGLIREVCPDRPEGRPGRSRTAVGERAG